jgi:serine/threonine protein kinase
MQNYIGQQIDRYRILAQQGMGGMAVVYKAYDTRLERDVAIKVIRTDAIPQDQHVRLLNRFEREAKSQAQFSHPNIVPVYDYGQVDGSPYLVMEYIAEGTLKDRLQKPIPYRTGLKWILPIVDALSYAHQLGIVHRDVKPSNILFSRDGRPILTDFGIAKVLETTEATLTGTGLGVGTPEYMAPEQWQGEASEACDQYSLGVVFYEILTGQKPYTAETPVAVALKQMNEPLQRPGEIVQGIPETVEKVLYKALSLNPHDRYESMHDFHKALSGLMQDIRDHLPDEEHVQDKVDSEGPTVDILDPKPVIASHPKTASTVSNAKKDAPRKIPLWALWAGLGVLLVCLIVIIVVVAAMGTDFINKSVDTGPTAESVVGEIFIEPTTKNETEDPLLTPTNIQQSEPTKEPKRESTATKEPTTTSSVYYTPTPQLYTPLSACAPSHLHVGDSAFVNYQGGKNRIRSEPDTSENNGVGEIQPGEVVRIVGGPVCNFGWILWEVETSRQETGWTPESDGEEFWLLPLATRDICEGALPTRLVVGKKAKVNEEPPDSNLIRSGPSRFDSVIGKIRPGNWMKVLEGPTCGEKANWWKVECLTTGVIGWTLEGNLEMYYLSPEP